MIASALLGACQPGVARGPDQAASQPAPGFSGERALALVDELLAWPRALGDPRRAASIEHLVGELQARGADTVSTLDHQGRDPWTADTYAMTTILAELRPTAARRFIVATHFDTRPWAEADPDPGRRDAPIPGANDGTSGVAVLLELLPHLAAELPADVGLSIILFDGEELGRPPAEGYCAGSRALAAAIEAGRYPHLRDAAFAVVIDMIGDADLEIVPETHSLASAPWLLDQIWESAAAAGYASFARGPARTITDDHVALAGLGIPSVLLIDLAYPPWHTHEDTLDKLSAASLEAVGETLRRALLALASR